MTDPTRPQPVVKEFDVQGAASGLIVAIGSIVFIVKAGITTGNLLTLGNLVGTALGIIAGAALWYSHRKAGQNAAAQVTPLESPRDYAGNELLTIDQWERAALRRGKHSEFNAAPPAPKPVPYARLRHDEDNLHPLGRIVRHDPRSLRYLVPESATVQSVMWQRVTPILDQGNLGSCTGNATVGALGSTPFYDTVKALTSLDEKEAVKVYSLATQLDDVAGTYPPDDTGSSGLGAAQAAKKLGLISGYQHITSVAAAHTAIAQGPFIVGTDWLTGMDNPDANGRVHATGSVRGGHEYQAVGYDAAADLWWFCNSWGESWGNNGRFAYSSADFAKLLAAQGDATVLVPITQPAPVPTPDPTPVPVQPTIPAKWVKWAQHTLTLKGQSKLTDEVATEIVAAGQA